MPGILSDRPPSIEARIDREPGPLALHRVRVCNVRHQVMGVFFVHIMKTGGTSVSRLLLEHFGEKAIYPPADAMGPTLNKMKPSELLELPPEQRAHIQVYSVHMPAWVAGAVAPEFCSFTVLREPVARTISHLRQAASTPWASESLEEIWDDPQWRLRLVDYQTPFFAGDEREARPPEDLAPSLQAFQTELARHSRGSGNFFGTLRPYFVTGVPYAMPLPDDAQHRARAQLASIDVVGVTEALGRATARLASAIGIRLPELRRMNVTPETATVSKGLLRRIRDDMARDLELYELARELAS
jgi:hypothetical protein